MNNRVPYNTATGRAFYNPATGRAIYIDQHVISAFSGSITFEYGNEGSPSTETCYDGPGAYNTFGLSHSGSTLPLNVTRLNNFNKLAVTIAYGFILNGGITSYSIEYLPSLNQLRFQYDRTWDYLSIPELGVDQQFNYIGYFGQSTPTVGIAGVYDTVVSQSCVFMYIPAYHSELEEAWSQTTDQTFSFTLALQ